MSITITSSSEKIAPIDKLCTKLNALLTRPAFFYTEKDCNIVCGSYSNDLYVTLIAYVSLLIISIKTSKPGPFIKVGGHALGADRSVVFNDLSDKLCVELCKRLDKFESINDLFPIIID